MSNKNAMLAKEQALVTTAQANFATKKAIIESMPDDLAMPWLIGTNGYCAEGSLVYQSGADLGAILKALPAVPCVFISGSTVSVKPVESVRDADFGWRSDVYPVIVVNGSGADKEQVARWWTKLGERTVEVAVKGSSTAEVFATFAAEAERYEASGYSYATGSVNLWKVRMYRAEDLPALTPKELWKQKGMEINKELMTEAQLTELMAETQRSVDQANTWFHEFFSKHGNPFGMAVNGELSPNAYEIFRFLFRKETGLAGNINWVNNLGAGAEVAYTLDNAHIRITCEYDSDLPALDWTALAEYYRPSI